MSLSREQLRRLAEIIRDEIIPSANSHTRVGQFLIDFVEFAEASGVALTAVSAHNTNQSAHGNLFLKTIAQALSDAQIAQTWENLKFDPAAAVTGAVRYDKVQGLTNPQMENSAANVGLPAHKGGFMPADVNNLDAEWHCFGHTPLWATPSYWANIETYYRWYQTYETIDGVLYTYQTRINGKYLQQRQRKNSGSWSAWKDVVGGTTLTGYRDDWTSPDQATLPYGEFGYVNEWGPIKGDNVTPGSFLIHFAVNYYHGQDAISSSQTQMFTNGTMRTRSYSGGAWGEWKAIGAPATTTQAGVVTLASNTGNSTDAGKVLALDSNGKQPVSETRQRITTGGTYYITDDIDVIDIYMVASNINIYLPETTNRLEKKVYIQSIGSGYSINVYNSKGRKKEIVFSGSPSYYRGMLTYKTRGNKELVIASEYIENSSSFTPDGN